MAGISKGGQLLVNLVQAEKNFLAAPVKFPLYTVLLVTGADGYFKADFGTFAINGTCLIFSTPLQTIQLKGQAKKMAMLQFHGDYYCIEYHRKEVACNGILFNDVYSNPAIALTAENQSFFSRAMADLEQELSASKPFDSVIIALVQLLLAKATGIRLETAPGHLNRDERMEMFRELIDAKFITVRKPAQYAEMLGIAPHSLTKRCKQYFMKTPSGLISERIILEAKKKLHLSRKSVKEIAYELNFEDEHYFSRFFKKATKVSPQTFRKETGISVVADLSIKNAE